MPSRRVQQAIVAVVATVGLVLGVLANGPRSLATTWGTTLKIYSISVTAVALLFLAHDRWLWRLRMLRFGRPLLAGTWRGKLTSTFVGTDGEEFKDLPVHLLVRSISATLMADRSESESTTTSLRCAPDGRWHLAWTYSNIPRPAQRQTSAPHRGTCDLVIGGAHGERLQGEYYTDRQSQGELTFDQWSKNFYGDASTASSASDFRVHNSLT
jgi:hypothetical protein